MLKVANNWHYSSLFTHRFKILTTLWQSFHLRILLPWCLALVAAVAPPSFVPHECNSVGFFGWCVTFPLTAAPEPSAAQTEFPNLLTMFWVFGFDSSFIRMDGNWTEGLASLLSSAEVSDRSFPSLRLACVSDLRDSFSPHPNTQVLFGPREDLLTGPSSSSSSASCYQPRTFITTEDGLAFFLWPHQSAPLCISTLCYCVKCTCATRQVVQWTDSIVPTLFSALSIRMYQVVFLFSGCEKQTHKHTHLYIYIYTRLSHKHTIYLCISIYICICCLFLFTHWIIVTCVWKYRITQSDAAPWLPSFAVRHDYTLSGVMFDLLRPVAPLASGYFRSSGEGNNATTHNRRAV